MAVSSPAFPVLKNGQILGGEELAIEAQATPTTEVAVLQ
jgi:hypothetical protein